MIQFEPRLQTRNVGSFPYLALQSPSSTRASEDFREKVGWQATLRQMSLTILKSERPQKIKHPVTLTPMLQKLGPRVAPGRGGKDGWYAEGPLNAENVRDVSGAQNSIVLVHKLNYVVEGAYQPGAQFGYGGLGMVASKIARLWDTRLREMHACKGCMPVRGRC